jgi:hypothetical protein
VEDGVVMAIQAKVVSIWDEGGVAFERAGELDDDFEHEELMQSYSLVLDAGISGTERVCVLLAMLTDGHGRFEKAETALQRLARCMPAPES